MENINKLVENLFDYTEDALSFGECDLLFQGEEETSYATLDDLKKAIEWASEKEKIKLLKDNYIPFEDGYIEIVFYEPDLRW